MSHEAETRARLLDDLAAAAERSPKDAASGPGFLRAVLGIAVRLDRLFELPHPDAPGLVYVGARVDPTVYRSTLAPRPASATGKAEDRLKAILSCVGEAAEYLSQLRWGDEQIDRMTPTPDGTGLAQDELDTLKAMAGYSGPMIGRDLDCVRARRLHDGAIVHVPASLCYRPSDPAPCWPDPAVRIGSGVGVGATRAVAALHAVLELIERDAVALWWTGGRAPTLFPRATLKRADAGGLLDRLRRGVASRRAWVLDITTDLGVPCAVAISCGPQGNGVSFGFSARLVPEQAIRAALVEMVQMEMAIHLVALKHRQQGEAALTAEDRGHIRRVTEVRVQDWDILRPPVDQPEAADACEFGDAEGLGIPVERQLHCLVQHLSEKMVYMYEIDQSREALGVQAVRILSSQLQPFPSSMVTERLSAQISLTSGGPGLKFAWDLL